MSPLTSWCHDSDASHRIGEWQPVSPPPQQSAQLLGGGIVNSRDGSCGFWQTRVKDFFFG